MIAQATAHFSIAAQAPVIDDRAVPFVLTVLLWVAAAAATYVVVTYGLRWVARRLPGEIDDVILGIIRRPLLVLIIVFGTLNSLEVLRLDPATVAWIERVSNTVLTLIIAYLMWRIIRDVVVHYGEGWAERTESHVGDSIIPLVNLFGTLLLVLIAALIILPMWEINVTSVLVGAGVVTLVLGLALQDTLANMFGAATLLLDAPFRRNELIVLDNGRICRVLRIGIRATKLYYLDGHAEIYVPNKDLAHGTVMNITKPTVDLKVTIDVGVRYDAQLAYVTRLLTDIAAAHPNVLVTDLEHVKIPLIEQEVCPALAAQIADYEHQVATPRDDMARRTLERLIADAREEQRRYQVALERFHAESTLNGCLTDLMGQLETLIATIREHERDGWTTAELQELKNRFVPPVETAVSQVVDAMKHWNEECPPDPWLVDPTERVEVRTRWQDLTALFLRDWHRLREDLTVHEADEEMLLDARAAEFLTRIREEYKQIPGADKEPVVDFLGFGGSTVNLRLEFQVDDIRRESFERKERVVREVALAIKRRFEIEGLGTPAS